MPPRQPQPGESLADLYPRVAAQWHPTKNGDLRPDQIAVGSHLKVWWKCRLAYDHEWEAKVEDRTRHNRGCPMCVGQAVSVTNSLATRQPDISAQWHPTKNGDLKPSQVTWGSTRREVWWKCDKGPDHEWRATVASRSSGKGCPMCAGLAVSVTNALAIVRPDVAAQWHPTKNGDLRPDQVVAGSHRKVWWKCDKGPDHDWEATVGYRSSGGGCPMCAGQAVSVTNSLAAVRPSVAAQWHPTKNGDLKPSQVTWGSRRSVWWKCDRGPDHEWQAAVASRSSGGGCPMCAGQAVSVTNSLSSVAPEVAAQWHPTKNGDLRPNMVAAGSSKSVWWKCDKGPDHEWKAVVYSRTREPATGCPMCSRKAVSATNSLAAVRPDLAAQWHPTRNGDLRPDQIVAGSNRKVWWQCDKGLDHVWKAPPSARTAKGRSAGCPMCAGQAVSVTNSLASLYPGTALQWHPTKNGDLRPERIAAGSGKSVWWKCDKGPDHEWQATPSNRTRLKSGCPMCAGQAVSVTNSLATRQPDVAAQWHPTKNGDLKPSQVTWGSRRSVWWKCDKGPDHEWQAAVSARSSGKGCPMCAGLALSVTNSLASLRPDLTTQWHPTRNGELTPSHVVAASEKNVWWVCDKGPDHVWRATPWSRTSGRNTGCPMCAGQAVSATNSLATRHPEVAREWHPTRNGDLRPSGIAAGSGKSVWWKCDKGPDHEWQTSPGKRTGQGRGCPMCAGQAVSITNSLAALYPLVAAQWHATGNGDLTPDMVAAHAGMQAWWRCPVDPNHIWRTAIAVRTRAQPNGCPSCSVVPRSLAEVRIAYELAELLHLDPDDHRLVVGGRTFDCDIVWHRRQLVMEYDSAYWHRSESRDRTKVERLQRLGWRVVRIREQPLAPITELDVAVPLGAPPKLVVDALLSRLAVLGDIPLEVAARYRQRTGLIAEARSLARIRELQAERARIRAATAEGSVPH